MIGFSVENNYPVPISEAVCLLKQVGFDAVAFNWKVNLDLNPGIEAARMLGLHITYLHAPQGDYHTLWLEDDPAFLHIILQALEDCRRWSVPIFVMHVCRDFLNITPDLSIGRKNFRRITDTAARYGISVAFENTEKPDFLEAVMNLYNDDDPIGFCWDSGHEQCYTPNVDHLQLYGHRLMVTHLNDNVGMACPGMPNRTDDLHLVPGDGTADWAHQLARLKKAKQVDILNFELKRVSKQDQKIRLYDGLSLHEYFSKVFDRANALALQYFK